MPEIVNLPKVSYRLKAGAILEEDILDKGVKLRGDRYVLLVDTNIDIGAFGLPAVLVENVVNPNTELANIQASTQQKLQELMSAIDQKITEVANPVVVEALLEKGN